MSREEVVEILLRDNPETKPDQLRMYADTFLEYQEAAQNLAEFGTICKHPRTGAPLENPYHRVRLRAMDALSKFSRVKNTTALWSSTGVGSNG